MDIFNTNKRKVRQYFLPFIFGLLTIFSCIKDENENSPSTNQQNSQNNNNSNYQNNNQNNNTISFSNCIVVGESSELEIASWNIKDYPLTSSTEENVRNIILQSKIDVFALQEIRKKSDFTSLLDNLTDYKGVIYVQSGLNLAFVYNLKEIDIINNPYAILKGDSYAFPRAPYVLNIKHKTTGLEIIIVNIHLKCCSGANNENRRFDAAKKLKNYVDANWPNENVIILGDFNDEIAFDTNNVFQIFIDDANNYEFADMEIAKDKSATKWTYPSYPSHIDHILITNELFDNISNTNTFIMNNCNTKYSSQISDHYPLISIFKK